MAWFQLDPQSLADRARSAGATAPSLGASITRGTVGFTVLSLAGFVPWAVFGRWFHRYIGEAGMYSVCALVFVGFCGPLLHRLIIGPGSMSRFYKLFGPAFALYSVAWITGYMGLIKVNMHLAGVVGLLSGALLMGAMFVKAFEAKGAFLKVVAALFLLNALGYFIGGVSEAALWKHHKLAAMMSWGLFYGLGLGAGLGLAFYYCQTRARELLAAPK